MATKSEAQTEQTPSFVTLVYRPSKELPPRGGNRLFDITERLESGGFNFEYYPFEPGRNKVPVGKWERIANTKTGQELLKLGALQLVENLQKPSGERPGPDDLKNLPIEFAIPWIEFEVSLFVLKAWEGSDYRGEVQKALRQRMAEVRDDRI